MDIKEARETISKALKEDEGLYLAYVSNIAMHLFDQRVELDKAREVAPSLLKLIFD